MKNILLIFIIQGVLGLHQELVNFMLSASPMPRFGKFGAHEPGGNFIFIAK